MRRRPADDEPTRLAEILGRVRGRWRARRVLGGGAIVLAAALLTIVVTGFGLEATRFSPTAVAVFRLIAWGTVGLLTVLLVLRPLLRRIPDEQVALYLEEHEPSLEAAILGAVEAEKSRGRAEHSAILDQLVRRAVRSARGVEDGDRIDGKGLRLASGSLAGVTVVALLLLLFGPSDVRRGASALLPTTNAAALNPYAVQLEPGDVTVARGSDQMIRAQLVGFDAEDVTLFTRTGESEALQRLSMIPATDGGVFELLLLGLNEGTEYFVESDGVRSSTFTIEVVDMPWVDLMTHRYRFPAYTGMEPREIEDAGDVAALPGTEVDLTITPTIPTTAGRILIDGEPAADLEIDAEGRLTGTLEVSERGYYQVEMALGDGRFVAASPEYRIDLLTDAPPSVIFETPGRDDAATPIEEVFFEMRADDDYGIGSLDLVYSVNGQSEDTVRVFSGTGRPLAEVTAGHTLYLEDFEVEPGDLVSYWAVARDTRGIGVGQEVVSDIYFLNVRPFDMDYREAPQQNGGGGGGAGGGEQNPGLSELQKQVIAATFNLIRDVDRYSADEYAESLTSVALAQGRVRAQVGTLVERMGNRGVTDDPQFRAIAELLPGAIAAMDSARATLEAGEPRAALLPEQRALRVLQRAEQSFEAYVSMQQQGGGGGGGGQQPNAEDLADLFELELDRLQDQYETVERGARQQQNEEVDELLQRLEELSRRQQQEAERQSARAGQQQGGGGGGGAGAQSQRELADQAEETARELQRLSRETGDADLAETARDLQRAADAMRRAAANPGSTGAAEAGRALDRLEEAQRRLQQDRETRLQEDAAGALERGRALRERQEGVTERLRNLPTQAPERAREIRALQEEKTDMLREVQDLERTLDRLAGDARQRDADAARSLTDAADEIRDADLIQKIAWSRGVIEQREESYVRIFEEGIRSDLEALEGAIARATQQTERVAEREGVEEALDQAQDLVRGMESLDRRLEARTQEEGGDAQGQGRQGEGRQADGQQAGDARNAGGQGGSARAGEAGGGTARGGQPGFEGSTSGGQVRADVRPFTEEEIRQFRREFQVRLEEALALREALEAEGRETTDIDAAIEAMRELGGTRVWGDLPAVAGLQDELRQTLGRLEFTLRREVEGDGADRAALTGSDAVPEGFRRLVEEYYRALARSGGNGGGR